MSKQVTEREFYLVNLLEVLDIFDWEQSEYKTRQQRLVTHVKNITKLVFKEPATGLPPVFRVAKLRSRLFISNAAKEALEQAGIKGASFVPQRKYR